MATLTNGGNGIKTMEHRLANDTITTGVVSFPTGTTIYPSSLEPITSIRFYASENTLTTTTNLASGTISIWGRN